MFQNLRITTKYPVAIVTLALLASVVTGILAYSTTSSELGKVAGEKLSALLEARKDALENYFAIISEDLRVQSQNPTIIEALNALSFSWHSIAEDRQQYFQKRYISENPFPIGEREKLNNAKDGSLYSQAHQKYHPVFRNLRKERGYYDIFLFDRHGDLVYTVVKESDYATNLLVGPWRDTNLGRAFRAVHDAPGNAGQFFFDFELYGPSQGYPASFIANALFDEDGSFIGVLAFQLPIDRLNAVMQVSAGMGETGETFLVGRDFFRRSDSRFLDQSLILRHKIESDVVLRAIGGEKGTNTYRNQQGKNVFSTFDFIDFKDVRWALVAEIDEDEILAPVKRMKQDMLIGFVVIAVAVTLIGIAVSRHLAGPILKMTDAMSKLAIGDFNSKLLLSNRKDEFGGMEQALRVFRENAIARSRVDVKLVEQAMLLKIVIENVAHGVALFDEDARLLVWNSRYLEYMGRKPGEITQGASFLEVAGYLARRGAYGEGDPEELVKKRLVLLRENKETKSEVVIGENDIFEVMSQRTPDGGFVVALTDVTTYREYQRKT